ALLDMERTTLTRNLRALVIQGWLKLSRGHDPRTRLVSITPSGRRKLAAAEPYWRAAQLQVEALLGAKVVGSLHDQIDKALLQLPFAPPQSSASPVGENA
ncbi:MAG TPA: MarR family winged helix-turn-helix transcriptional regulator, partial [Burkholderiales bacterium]|nr:MarR family winged helix-turn-helix transcriptional regulator [Burkholderiales bacterium]